MKNLLSVLIITLVLASCGESTNSNDKPSASNSKKTSQNLNYKDLKLIIEFNDGPLKGKHTFLKKKNGSISFVSLNYFDKECKNEAQRHTSSFGGQNMISEDGNLTLMFLTKKFEGAITPGKHNSKTFDRKNGPPECGKFMIADTGEKYDFERMYSKNISCNSINIGGASDWNIGTIYNRRAVAGDFVDTFELEFNNKKGKTVQNVTTEVSVVFVAREQKLKQQ